MGLQYLNAFGRLFISHNALTVGDYAGAGSVGHSNLRDIDNMNITESCAIYMQDIDHVRNREVGHYTLNKNQATAKYHYRRPLMPDKKEAEKLNRLEAVDYIRMIRGAQLLKAYGSYGSKQYWLAVNNAEYCELVESLEDYPIINDETHSQIEINWKNYFINDNLRDFEKSAYKALLNQKMDDEQAEILSENITEDDVFEALSMAENTRYIEWSYDYSGAYIDSDSIADELASVLLDNIDNKQQTGNLTMTPSKIKASYERSNPEGRWFSRENMRFAGDTMTNFGSYSVTVKTYSGDVVDCWCIYRKRKTSKGAPSGAVAYFDKSTFEVVHGDVITA